jgi:hypothetical protein
MCRARVLQQQQRSQAHDFHFARKQVQQQSRQPDGFLAQRQPDVNVAAAGGIAFVEQQVNHRGHRHEPVRALYRAGRFERDCGGSDAVLRPGDALLHRALADQERPRDLGDRQARNNAQRQWNLLGRGQFGMAADE